MKPLALRPLTAWDQHLTRLQVHWRRIGLVASVSCLDPEARYLRFNACTSAGYWQGLIDADQWLARTLAQLPTLLPPALHLQACERLFSALPQPLEVAVAGLDYLRMVSVQALEGTVLAEQSLPCLSLAWGSLWLAELPALPTRAATMPGWLDTLGLPLRLLLGRSVVDAQTLARLAPGDLLVLGQGSFESWLGGQHLGRFRLSAHGFSLSASKEPSPMEYSVAPKLEPPPLDSLKVTVEFVLHETQLSLAELGSLDEGQVLPLPSEAYRRVQLRANGKCLGHGELVQLEGCLAVELHSVGEALADE